MTRSFRQDRYPIRGLAWTRDGRFGLHFAAVVAAPLSPNADMASQMSSGRTDFPASFSWSIFHFFRSGLLSEQVRR
jgi:hypothetical protein